MRLVAILLVCLLPAGCGRRNQKAFEKTQSTHAFLPSALRTLPFLEKSTPKRSPSFRLPNSRLDDAAQLRSVRIPPARMQFGKFGDALKAMVDGGGDATDLVDNAPSWGTLLTKLDQISTEEERLFREELASGRGERACALASSRLFDLPEGETPRVMFFRDTAAWCPYCEKVWLALEEKRVPYEVVKVNMNCYGEKPDWFWQMQPSGGIPVAKIDGQVIRESDDIIAVVEQTFPERPLYPSRDDPAYDRVPGLLRLERQLFSAWFQWLTSPVLQERQREDFEALLRRVDEELGVAGGPFFLGKNLSIVDVRFAPFFERMAASLAYYKGLTLRRNTNWPHVEEWFLAMEGRPSYRHIQSDFYTHVKDLPPQIGLATSMPAGDAFKADIDGTDGSWSLPLPQDDGALLQPLTGLGQSEDAARREAAERLLANHDDVARFAARGLSGPGFPSVSAPLSDPNAKPNENMLPVVDALLRHVVSALLDGPEAARAQMSSGINPRDAAKALGYLRDRISVPRDMSYPAARQLRAHLNYAIDSFWAGV